MFIYLNARHLVSTQKVEYEWAKQTVRVFEGSLLGREQSSNENECWSRFPVSKQIKHREGAKAHS